MTEPTKYIGKYRGSVVTNIDPMGMARLQVQVPDVLGAEISSWALPAFPVAGDGMGMHVIPPVGAGVWVEFEQGDPSYPMWTGCWYGGATELPADAQAAVPGQAPMVLQTQGRHALVMSDTPGGPGITLKSPSGASIVIDDTGIHISNGQGATIDLVGPSVTINGEAFKVT